MLLHQQEPKLQLALKYFWSPQTCPTSYIVNTLSGWPESQNTCKISRIREKEKLPQSANMCKQNSQGRTKNLMLQQCRTLIAAQMASRFTKTTPSRSSWHNRNVSSPTTFTATPSAKPPTCWSNTRWPWWRDKAIAFASAGSTPMTFTCPSQQRMKPTHHKVPTNKMSFHCVLLPLVPSVSCAPKSRKCPQEGPSSPTSGRTCFIYAAMPAIRPPPPMGTKTTCKGPWCCLTISMPTVPWPAITSGWSNGGMNTRPSSMLRCLAYAWVSSYASPTNTTVAPSLFTDCHCRVHSKTSKDKLQFQKDRSNLDSEHLQNTLWKWQWSTADLNFRGCYRHGNDSITLESASS